MAVPYPTDAVTVGRCFSRSYGLTRATDSLERRRAARRVAAGALDIWIRTTPENRRRVWRALERFGTPLHELEEKDLAADDLVFQIGLAPQRIDIPTSIDGVDFEEAWPERFETAVAGQPVPVISRAHLARNKRASGRPQDLADLAWLEKGKSE